MKITTRIEPEILETAVDVAAKTQDELDRVVYALEGVEKFIVGTVGNSSSRVSLSDILYFDLADKKSFAYTADLVYEVDKRLFEIEAMLPHEFMRCGKAAIINLARVENFRQDFSGRIKARMQNGEQVVISRKYVKSLKEKLGNSVSSKGEKI